MRLALHRVNGRRVPGAPVPLPEEGAVLGSAPSADLLGLQLDASLHVARSHARIIPLCGHWMLSLADEHMVCAVNGSKILWGELYTLAPGDSIQLGFTELRVESAERAPLSDAAFFAALPADTSQAAADIDLLLPVATDTAYLSDPAISHPPAGADRGANLCHLSFGEESDTYKDKDTAPDAAQDSDAGLSPEAALLQQLDTDFSASATSRALSYQSGQPLDAILASPTVNPALAGLVLLLPEEAPAPSALPETVPVHESSVPCGREPFASPASAPAAPAFSASAPTDQDFFAQLAQPRPLNGILSPPSFCVAEESAAYPVPSLSELLDTQDPALSLEDILDGPLHIDDVLRALDEPPPASPGTAFTAPPPFTLDVLQQEIPPDPLTLLGGVDPTPAWDSSLSPLLRGEHHQSDLHTPYTLPSAGTATKDKESA